MIKLSPGARIRVVNNFKAGMSIKEIADSFGVSEEQIKGIVKDIKKKQGSGRN